MLKNTTKWIALLGCATLAAGSAAYAQDGKAVLDALVKKGLLTSAEAAEIAKNSKSPIIATSAGKSTTALAISGRVQTQFVGFNNENTADSTGFIMRRIYLGAKAKLGSDWTADFNYNFADASVDKAFIEWSGDFAGQDVLVDVGFRKVNFGYEETTSSASLKAIERSPATRFFVEGDFSAGPAGNDRELAAGSRRIGVFADFNKSARSGKEAGLYYGFAFTNPERQSGDLGTRRGAGNNIPALWADVGYSFKGDSAKGKFGAAISHIREGVAFDAPGADATLTGFSVYGDVTLGQFNIAGEFLTADLKDGALVGAAVVDANPYGFWIQPSFKVSDKFELVTRYSYVEGDGRGLRLRDLVRRSDSTITADELQEFYFGGNYYLKGNDVKLQLGYIFAEAETNAGVTEDTKGIRAQMQILF